MHNRSTLPIDKLLSKLTQAKVKKPSKEGFNQWQALCPSHADKTPSLNITECTDGTVLLKCWTGCSASEIVKAVGLELKDLFVYKPSSYLQLNQRQHKQSRKKHPRKQAIDHEKLIILLGITQTAKGQPLTPNDLNRYQLAVKRIRGLIND